MLVSLRGPMPAYLLASSYNQLTLQSRQLLHERSSLLRKRISAMLRRNAVQCLRAGPDVP